MLHTTRNIFTCLEKLNLKCTFCLQLNFQDHFSSVRTLHCTTILMVSTFYLVNTTINDSISIPDFRRFFFLSLKISVVKRKIQHPCFKPTFMKSMGALRLYLIILIRGDIFQRETEVCHQSNFIPVRQQQLKGPPNSAGTLFSSITYPIPQRKKFFFYN